MSPGADRHADDQRAIRQHADEQRADGQRADVAVVVLNWRRYGETARCLESLRSLPSPIRPYLVDNASDARALEPLRRAFPDVTLLPQADNLGFAGGMNRGIARALEDGALHVMLLNNDARVTPRAVEALLEVFDADPQVGIVGAMVRFPSPDERVQSAGIDVDRRMGRVQLRFSGRSLAELPSAPFPVDAVSGAALMISAAALRVAGMMDPDYFFYYEDIDLCLRVREAGLKVMIAPDAVVCHDGGATIGRSPAQVYYGVRNQLRFVARWGSRLGPGLEAARRAFVAGLNLGQLVRERRVALRPGLSHLARGIADFRAGHAGPCPERL